LLLGKILYTAHMFFVTLIMYEKKVQMVLAIYALTLVVSISSNVILIPRFSSMGAATTFCVTNLFFTGAIYAANRFYRSRSVLGTAPEVA
jgi:O-antigen/teichoic acid export membrane protein